MTTIILKYPRDFPEDIAIIVQLYLSGTIKDHIIILPNKLVEFRLEPILILQEVLHAIQ